MRKKPIVKWFGALPQAEIIFGDETYNLTPDATFDRLIASLSMQLKAHRPMVVQGHDESGDSYGNVEALKVLTLSEAQALGITEQTSPRMIYFGASELVEGDLKRKQLASANVRPGVKDENGKVWDFWLDELSFLRNPHIRFEQANASDIPAFKFAAFAAAIEEAPVADPNEKTESDDLAARTAEVTQLRADLTAKDEELVSLRTELETCQKELADSQGMQLESEGKAAAKDLAVGDDELEMKLAALYVSSKDAFQLAAHGITSYRDKNKTEPSAATEPKETDPVVTAFQLAASDGPRKSGRGVPQVEPEDEGIAAMKLAASEKGAGRKMTFSQALSKIRAQAK